MSMTVKFVPSDLSSGTHYPTPNQIAEAFTAVGLQPPPLESQQMGTANVQISSSAILKRLAQVVTRVVKEQTQADDALLRSSLVDEKGKPVPTFADRARKHLRPAQPGDDTVVSLAAYALPVLMRMPARNPEDREKRRLASESLMYTSVIAPTRSQFVVSAENQGSITLRLHNQLIERLEQACEHMLKLLATPIEIAEGTVELELLGRIEIYEVGQEDSTITGLLVGLTRGARLKHMMHTEPVQVWTGILLLVIFSILFVFLFLYHTDHHGVIRSAIHGTGAHAYVKQNDEFWIGEFQRLQSGIIPVMLVTAITLAVKYPRRDVVSWTQILRADEG